MRGTIFLLALGACDSLAGAEYVGQPMFTLRGTFSVAPGSGHAGGVALFWQASGDAGGPGVAATALPVTTELASFRADVPEPPPAAARFSLDGVELAEAYVYVVDDPAAAHLVPRGSDRARVLVYASVDVEAGTLAADYLGGPMSAGYHLRRFTPTSTPARAQALMIARCTDGGSLASACAGRRGYQLGSAEDNETLRIAVTP